MNRSVRTRDVVLQILEVSPRPLTVRQVRNIATDLPDNPLELDGRSANDGIALIRTACARLYKRGAIHRVLDTTGIVRYANLASELVTSKAAPGLAAIVRRYLGDLDRAIESMRSRVRRELERLPEDEPLQDIHNITVGAEPLEGTADILLNTLTDRRAVARRTLESCT